MKYTNKYNLDEWLCEYLAQDDYDYEPGVLSATTLIGPARAWALKMQHPEDLVIDYSDLIRLKNGSAIHAAIELSGVAERMGGFQEKRFYAEFNGFRISGKMDMILDGVINDFKSTSVWKAVKAEYDDYVKQLSIYRWLLEKNGISTADFGYIHFFFTDWKKADMLKNSDYPPIPYLKVRLNLWSIKQLEMYLSERTVEFAFALGCLPECTPAELWKDPDKWAVYRKAGQSKAFRVLETEGEAQALAADIGGTVEYRPSKARRCGYCTARFVCSQYAVMKEAGLVDGD